MSDTTREGARVRVDATPNTEAGMSGGVSIRSIAPETPLVDVMGGAARREVKVHEHGFLALVDVMPRLVPQGQTADAAIVQSARVSYGHGTKQITNERETPIGDAVRGGHEPAQREPISLDSVRFTLCEP